LLTNTELHIFSYNHSMKDLWKNGLLPKILLLGIVIALLGLMPFPKEVASSLEQARRAQKSGNLATVAANLASVAEQQPWRIGFWQSAAEAALAANDPQSAGGYFARAASKGELSADGYLFWGDADLQADSLLTALQIWGIASRLGVAPAETLPREAEVYRALGDDRTLIENLRAQITLIQQGGLTLDDRPSSAVSQLYLELGLLLAAYDPAAAPAYLLPAAELNPGLEAQIRNLNFTIQRELSKNDPVYLLTASGRALANQGRWDLAEKAFSNATELQPEYAEAWAYLGEARQHTGSGSEALSALQRALELDPQSVAANTFMALYWQRQEEPEVALDYLERALELDPQNPAFLVEIGNLTALLGDLAAGQEYYWQAITLQPNDPRYVREFLKFSLRYNLNLQEVALPLARQLVIANPEDPASQDVMGEVLFRLGDLLNAERFFLRALDYDPGFDQAHLHLGALYHLQGKPDLARDQYNQVLELTSNDQTYSQAQEALDEYFSP
jgi:tetratricopeptide (TPR) repeat protein